MLTKEDFDQILAAMQSIIAQAIQEKLAAMRKSRQKVKEVAAAAVAADATPTQYSRGRRLSKLRADRKTVDTEDLRRRIDRAERYQNQRLAHNSELASTLAVSETQRLRSEGKPATFREVHGRIRAELDGCFQIPARYAKQLQPRRRLEPVQVVELTPSERASGLAVSLVERARNEGRSLTFKQAHAIALAEIS